MNRKMIFKMVGLMIIGGFFGAGFTLGLEAGKDVLRDQWLPLLADSLMDYSFGIMLAASLLLFLLTTRYFIKGKTLLLQTKDLEEEALDLAEKEARKNSNKALAINSILLVLNFMMYGMSFDLDRGYFLAKTLLFLIVSIACSVIEILTVKLMQKYDDRLKGDPTSLKFHKDFLGSCDEAEKLKIYQSGYQAFQFTKNGSFVLVIITILLKITDFIGSFPVFIASVFLIIVLGSYNYYAIKADQ